jgi:hypothetical protein
MRMGFRRQQRGNVSPRGGFWIERNPFHPCIDRPVVNSAWLTSVFIDQNLSPTSITLNGKVLDCSNEMFCCVHFDRLNKTLNWIGCFSRQNANSGCVSGGLPRVPIPKRKGPQSFRISGVRKRQFWLSSPYFWQNRAQFGTVGGAYNYKVLTNAPQKTGSPI